MSSKALNSAQQEGSSSVKSEKVPLVDTQNAPTQLPYKLQWVFGHESKVPPVNLSTQGTKSVVFSAGSIVICLDWMKNTQSMLVGHKNDVISIAASPSKKFIASADSGPENSLIIWHSKTKMIFNKISGCFPIEGIVKMSFSHDGELLMTLTGGKPQVNFILFIILPLTKLLFCLVVMFSANAFFNFYTFLLYMYTVKSLFYVLHRDRTGHGNPGKSWEKNNRISDLEKSWKIKLFIWDWKSKKEEPEDSFVFENEIFYQHYAGFHSMDPTHFLSCSQRNVYFFKKEEKTITHAVLDMYSLYDEKACIKAGEFTQTVFSLNSSLAITATKRGKFILWGRPLHTKTIPAKTSNEWFFMDPKRRACIRVFQTMATKCSILFLEVRNKYLIAGTEHGEVLYYDEDFRIQWSISLKKGPIISVSYNFKPSISFKGAIRKVFGKSKEENDDAVEFTDFLVCTTEGYAGYVNTATGKVKDILSGTAHSIKSVAVSPTWPYIYTGDQNGNLKKWNYNTRCRFSRQLLNEDSYKASCCEIECLAIDIKGSFIACGMSDGSVALFDAIVFSGKPFFTDKEVLHRPTRIQFSPDSQHLIVVDSASFITRYRFQLLVPLKTYEVMENNTPTEELFVSYGGKTRQHNGRIVDCLFDKADKEGSVLFYTLGEDRFLVEYDISNSKANDVELSKRMILEKKPVPICMSWYPLFGIKELIAVISDDDKMRIYSTREDQLIRMVSLPIFEEPIRRVLFLEKEKLLFSFTSGRRKCLDYLKEDILRYFIFKTDTMVGLIKYPIDGNPNTSLAVDSHPKGINMLVPDRYQNFVFTAGVEDSFVYMYEIDPLTLIEEEIKACEGIDGFKNLFPTNEDPEEMKKRLILSVYSLELELKLLKFGGEEPVLKGEIPINCLEYVMAAMGCFLTVKNLELMMNDIKHENKYMYGGKKTTLNCLDVMKLYVNYRPQEFLSKERVIQAFKDILVLEDDPDYISRNRFLDIVSTQGDKMSKEELVNIVRCLKTVKPKIPWIGEESGGFKSAEGASDGMREDSEKQKYDDSTEQPVLSFEELIPEYITEEIFIRDILCLEPSKEDLSKYVLKKEDQKLVEEKPSLSDFLSEIQALNLFQ
ncbi:cilia- and flagella-associated protein 251-like [Uloborus diversus]|uniref:cilia- and flagella-associated protein 251-like n=1 Tax=Uloborus diversus TaxID=327109 RepID=UPI00240A7125|nr:cilia- and flagella-associated protein 251-like [Uloborus diversus]